MKRSLLILLLGITVFVSCKNDKKSEEKEITISNDSEKTAKQNDGLTLLKGEFVYYSGAAVLQTHAEIYGVIITNKMLELNGLAQKYKTEPTDMVNVTVRGKITKNKHEKILWENKVKIVEILDVKPIAKEDTNVAKLGNK